MQFLAWYIGLTKALYMYNCFERRIVIVFRMYLVEYIDDLANTATERVQQKNKYKKPLLIINIRLNIIPFGYLS